MTKTFTTIRREWAILLILLAAFILRIWGLTTQSLWLDELHNMNEADPSLPWSELFEALRCCDQHPPLYFIIERLAFTFFGHTEFVARSISVIAGTVSVWVMFLLGKEVYNKKLGYITALLTCVNYYNIFYSQEARGYSFLFLFAAWSFLYFIRLIKSPVRKNAILYVVFTLLMMYSHYFGLFAAISQGVLALLFIFLEGKGPSRIKLFKTFLFSGIVLAIGYAPWIPFLLKMSDIKSFWIGTISGDFAITFFKEYFGGAKILIFTLVLLLAFYILNVFLKFRGASLKNIKDHPLPFSFIIIAGWVFITYAIPYIRSILVVPMLHPRYTIVVVPAILLAIAFGIALIKKPLIMYITALIVILSLVDIISIKKYYTGIHKTQFREMTAFVVGENKENYPIINQLTSWHQSYYLKKMGSNAKLLTGDKENLVDSILTPGNPDWNFKGFWIVGAHGDKPISDEKKKLLEKDYILLKQQQFSDAWAQLFIFKKDIKER